MALTPATNNAGDTSGYYLYTPELRLMAETAISTATTKVIAYSYLWFGDLPVASVETAMNTTRWYATDHLGTQLLMTDASGAVVWRAEHTPYGGIYAFRAGATLHQPLRLPGQTAQDGNDAYYNIARWYRPNWRRYTQADPTGLDGGLNIYAYAEENPISAIDPFGLKCCPKSITALREPVWNPRTGKIAIKHRVCADVGNADDCAVKQMIGGTGK